MVRCDRIILIDRSATVHKEVKAAMLKINPAIDVIAVNSVTEARLVLPPPDPARVGFILLDCNSPSPNAAHDFLRWRKVTEPWPRIPTLLVGEPTALELAQAYNAGITDAIRKPLSPELWEVLLARTFEDWCKQKPNAKGA